MAAAHTTGYGVQGDERALVDEARDYARSVLLPLDREYDVDEKPITSALPELAEMGFLNICIPEELGGLGCSYQTYAAIIHELAYASPSAAVTVAVHNMVGAILNAHADDDQKVRWLANFGRAEYFSAFAITEAGAGSDAAQAQTRADLVDGHYSITGEKMWITNGLSCRWLLTLARDSSAKGNRPLSAIMVDGNQDSIRRDPIHGKLGIRASETAVVTFDQTQAPVSDRLGDPGKGLSICFAALDRGRVGIAAQALGIAEACLDEMVAYARTREQFGRPIGNFQAIQNMISDSSVELEAARVLVERAAWAIDSGEVDTASSAKAKLYSTEAANRIAYRAIQVHGGTGYVHECRVEQLFRDARVTTIYEGTSEIQRLVIAREVVSQLKN